MCNAVCFNCSALSGAVHWTRSNQQQCKLQRAKFVFVAQREFIGNYICRSLTTTVRRGHPGTWVRSVIDYCSIFCFRSFKNLHTFLRTMKPSCISKEHICQHISSRFLGTRTEFFLRVWLDCQSEYIDNVVKIESDC